MYISDHILKQRCDIKELTSYVYNTIGDPISAIYTDIYDSLPCYYTEINYETLPGKEPIKNVYRIFINGLINVNTNHKIFIDNKKFDILNVAEVYDNNHVEMIIKLIEI